MQLTKNYLEKLNSNQVLELSKFIVDENFKHHSTNVVTPKDCASDIYSIYNEESAFFKNSQIFAAKDQVGKIKGAIRVLQWNYVDVLPIQKIFNINPLLISGAKEANNIYHIGRFAISKTNKDLNLFKKLMVCAIAPICTDKSNIAFAECDSKLMRVILLLGIKAKVIGKPIQYLGSKTIPVCMDYDGLINFYNDNKVMVSNENLLTEYTGKSTSASQSIEYKTYYTTRT